jgi:hypothetical protein
MGDLYASLASRKDMSSARQLEDWKQARTSCQKSLAVWNDKQKRGELESSERDEAAQVSQCVASAEARLSDLAQRK